MNRPTGQQLFILLGFSVFIGISINDYQSSSCVHWKGGITLCNKEAVIAIGLFMIIPVVTVFSLFKKDDE